MKKWMKVLAVVLCLCFLQTPVMEGVTSVTEVQAAVKKGLKKEKGKYYYYVRGRKVKNTWKSVKIKNKKTPIKTTLLDQSIICGIGNIYDDEILFMSSINPIRKSCDITLEECDKIIKNTNIVLNRAIELGGTTIKSFTSSEGVHGLFQNELLVHGQQGEKCPKCGSILKKIKVAGRGTTYCPKCQEK